MAAPLTISAISVAIMGMLIAFYRWRINSLIKKNERMNIDAALQKDAFKKIGIASKIANQNEKKRPQNIGTSFNPDDPWHGLRK